MSDRDSFIDEVSEEVRRDRMSALWRRYGPYVIGAIVLIVALAGAKAWMDVQAERDSRAAGGAMIAAAEVAPTEAAEALTTLADQTDREGAAVLARLRAAGAYAEAGRAGEAAEAYRMVAEDGAADPLFRDFAAFREVMARAQSMSPAALIEALTPIADGNGPFRLLALEARGAAELSAGDVDAAAASFRAIAADEAAPQSLRQRVEAVLNTLGLDGNETG